MAKSDLTKKYEEILKKRIIEGYYQIGESIPPLRSLAQELNCSRSVVNVVVAKLAAQGYLEIQKRQKTIVNDFLNKGSLSIIRDIFFNNNPDLKMDTVQSILDARKLIEVEAVSLACLHSKEEEILELERIIEKEMTLIKEEVINFKLIAENDFSFHNQIIKMSNNVLYILIMNSIKDIALEMTKFFYKTQTGFFQKYVETHQIIAQAIRMKDQKTAANKLDEILEHGEKIFIKLGEVSYGKD
jgi:GntR family transcriptional repressor for pyruvate dehydrogenase complex